MGRAQSGSSSRTRPLHRPDDRQARRDSGRPPACPSAQLLPARAVPRHHCSLRTRAQRGWCWRLGHRSGGAASALARAALTYGNILTAYVVSAHAQVALPASIKVDIIHVLVLGGALSSLVASSLEYRRVERLLPFACLFLSLIEAVSRACVTAMRMPIRRHKAVPPTSGWEHRFVTGSQTRGSSNSRRNRRRSPACRRRLRRCRHARPRYGACRLVVAGVVRARLRLSVCVCPPADCARAAARAQPHARA